MPAFRWGETSVNQEQSPETQGEDITFQIKLVSPPERVPACAFPFDANVCQNGTTG